MSTAEHRAKRAAYMRAWNAKNCGRLRDEQRRRYREDGAYRQTANRKALLTHLRLRGGVEEETEAMLPLLQCDPCSYCGEPLSPPECMDRTGVALDHIDPAGDSHWTNLTAACRSCNASKGNMRLLLSMLERQLRRDFVPIAEQLWIIKARSGQRRRIDF